jgi:uncharacterized protein (TIGR00369 family)
MSDMLAIGREILAAQGFSRLLGTEMTAYGPDGVELRLPLRPELLQQNGFAHGGVVSYLADNALTYAGGAAMGIGVLTAEYKINYVRPGVGNALVARAEVLYAGKSLATCRCDVFSVLEDGTEKLCATAQGTIAKVGR